MIKSTISLFCITIASVSANINPGVTLSLDFETIAQAKNVYFHKVIEAINKVQIPNITFDQGFVNGNGFQISIPSTSIDFKPTSNNSVVLSVSDLGAQFHASDFRFKQWFLVCKGYIDATLKDISVSVEVQLGEQTLPNGKIVPKFKNIDASVDLPAKSINLSIHGNSVAKIANAFQKVFMGLIRTLLSKQIKNAILTQLDEQINQQIAAMNGQTEILSGLNVDWSLPKAPMIDSKSMKLGVKGLVFTDEGEEEPARPAREMPYHDDKSPAKFQIFLSNYFGNSFGESFLKKVPVHFFVKHDDVPDHIPFQLNTGYMNIFFPGLWDYYGSDLPINIENRLTNLRDFSSSENDKYLAMHLDAQVILHVLKKDGTEEEAVNIHVNDLFINFTLEVEDMHILNHVNDIRLLSIKAASSKFNPRLPLDYITKFFNWVNDIGKSLINFISRLWKMPIPSRIIPYFRLSDLKLHYYDNFFEAAFTPTFVQPQLPDISAEFEKWYANKTQGLEKMPDTITLYGNGAVSETVNQEEAKFFSS